MNKTILRSKREAFRPGYPLSSEQINDAFDNLLFDLSNILQTELPGLNNSTEGFCTGSDTTSTTQETCEDSATGGGVGVWSSYAGDFIKWLENWEKSITIGLFGEIPKRKEGMKDHTYDWRKI